MRIMLAIMTTAEIRSGKADPSSACRQAYRSAGGSATGFKPSATFKLRQYRWLRRTTKAKRKAAEAAHSAAKPAEPKAPRLPPYLKG